MININWVCEFNFEWFNQWSTLVTTSVETVYSCHSVTSSRTVISGLSEKKLSKVFKLLLIKQGHPTSIFGKYLVRRRFEIQNFGNICCKISCLPASARIFEHLKNGISPHFWRIFTLKRSPRIFGSLFSGWNFWKGNFWSL